MSKKRSGGLPRPEPRRFEIRLTRAAERGLAGLDTAVLRRSTRPSSVWPSLRIHRVRKKLQGTGDFYRIRIGDYRVIYQVEDEHLVVLVVNVGHRRDIYRDR